MSRATPKRRIARVTDTQRLNWLEKNQAMVNVGEAPGWEGPHVNVHDEHFKGTTYRDVIDKAMRAMDQ